MFCKYCGKEIENGAESCPYCGKSFVVTKNAEPEKGEKAEEFRQSVGPEDGTNSAAAAGTQPPRTGGLSRQWIIAIVVIVIAVVVIVGVVLFVNNRSGNAGNNNGITSEVKPKLSATNVDAAKEAVSIVDRFFEEGWPSYGSMLASEDLRDAEKKFVTEQDSAAEEVRADIEAKIDKILVELQLNDKTVSNLRRFNKGGDLADLEVIEDCRNEIENLINTYS